MRRLSLGSPSGNTVEQKLDWVIKSLQEIERASHELDAQRTADSFTVTNLTEVRSLDCNSGTLADLAAAQAAIDATRDFVATFVRDLKNRGQKRT